MSLHAALRRSHWPAILFSANMVIFILFLILQSVFHPGIRMTAKMELFSPLLIGAFSPLAAYLISPFRFHLLFRSSITFEKWTVSFVTFMALLWTIVYIRIEDTIPGGSMSALPLAILTIAAVSAPFAEEILFREAFPSLFGNYPHYAGHLISAVFFAASHLPASLYMGFLYLLAALFLSVLRMNTESLLYPFIAHALANVISLYV